MDDMLAILPHGDPPAEQRARASALQSRRSDRLGNVAELALLVENPERA
jgi:hypothetical protein